MFEIGPATRITEIEPVSVRVRVVELGPLDPERVAFPSNAPISEALPGDRVRLEIEVVDTDGLALPDEQLDSVWLLYHPDVPLDDPALDLRCDELETWTLDSWCRLGEGHGSIEFQVPGLGEMVDWDQRLLVYSVIAWNGRTAEDCWSARRNGDELSSDCGFMRSSVAIGPPWWLLAHATSEHVTTTMSVELFHPAVYLQQANRVPQLDHVVVGLEDTEAVLAASDGIVGPISVDAGQTVSLTIAVDDNLQFSQAYFFPLTPKGNVFTLWPEVVLARVATAGPIRVERDQWSITEAIVVQIDEDAEPGIARVVLAIHDTRGGEIVVRVELDVQ